MLADYLSLFLVFVFGTVIGSFLNVLALRYNTGEPFWKGRSKCFSCGKVLLWRELVPLVSFLIQKGKCLGCRSRISARYPSVEFLTGFLFTLNFWVYGLEPAGLIFGWLAMSLLIVIAVYDLRHFIIPDALVYIFIIISFLYFLFSIRETVFDFGDLFFKLLPAILMFSFFGLLWLISKGKWFGFGDAKLALGMGFSLGLSQAFAVLLAAFWFGFLVSVFLLVFNKKITLRSKIPFAPFLIFGFLLVYFGLFQFPVLNIGY